MVGVTQLEKQWEASFASLELYVLSSLHSVGSNSIQITFQNTAPIMATLPVEKGFVLLSVCSPFCATGSVVRLSSILPYCRSPSFIRPSLNNICNGTMKEGGWNPMMPKLYPLLPCEILLSHSGAHMPWGSKWGILISKTLLLNTESLDLQDNTHHGVLY